jgi:chromate transporter
VGIALGLFRRGLPGALAAWLGFTLPSAIALVLFGLNGWSGAAIALVAIFLPAFLLVIGALPLREVARRHPAMQAAMRGVNAAVVGLLLAAFYHPVWSSAIRDADDFPLATTGFLLVVFWRTPPWVVVLLSAAAAGLVPR